MALAQIIISGLLFLIFPIPFLVRSRRTIHIGGLFNLYETLEISRDKFAWRFLNAVYMIPILVVLVLVAFRQNFELWTMNTFLITVTIASLINSASARLQAVYIERDEVVDTVVYIGIVFYLLMFTLPSGLFRLLPIGPDLSGRVGAEFYLPIITGIMILFVSTIFGFVLYLYRKRDIV